MLEKKNVLDGELKSCCKFPMTGFYRDGFCHASPEDSGQHTVCIVATKSFLEFSVSVGNDLSTAHTEMNFPGLIAGDRWCLCAQRWLQAYEAGCAPAVVLSATNKESLKIIPLQALKDFAIDEEDLWSV